MSTLFNQEAGTDMFSNLHNEIDRVFNQFRDSTMSYPGTSLLSGNGMQRLQPRVDISETDGQIQVEAELPGVELADVEVSVTNESLVIEGRKSTESEKKEKNYHLVERSQGQFVRRIPLGFYVDADKINATFKNGVLTVAIQKPEEHANRKKRIEVKSDAVPA